MPTMLVGEFSAQVKREQRFSGEITWPPDPPETWYVDQSHFPMAGLHGDWVDRTWERLHLYREYVQAWRESAVDEVRAYSLPVSESFQIAMSDYPTVSVEPNVMSGAPCVDGTRIPVYMILDAIEHHGSLNGALESYPNLTVEQVKDVIGFAKIVVECPLGDDKP